MRKHSHEELNEQLGRKTNHLGLIPLLILMKYSTEDKNFTKIKMVLSPIHNGFQSRPPKNNYSLPLPLKLF